MNHISEPILRFSDELRQILSVLSDHLNLHVENADLIHKGVMDLIERLLTASDAINAKYFELNMAPGAPISPVEYGAKDGFYRRYEDGAIYYHPETGVYWVQGAIFAKYVQLGAEAGFLRYPLTDETGAPDGVGRYNHFQGGSIYWKPATGANETHGAIRDKWNTLGGEQGILGYPLTDETKTVDGIGRFNHFERGSIYWTPDTDAWEVHGLIRDRWAALGWETSYLGYPTFDEKDWTTSDNAVIGRISRFQRGTIALSTGSTVPVVLPDTVILSSGPLNPPEPITGWVELMINSAGFFSYKGHLHNSGGVGYHVSIASALNFQDADGGVMVATEETHLGGTASIGEDRDHDWMWSGFEQRIRDNWDILHTRGLTTITKVNVTAGDAALAVIVLIPVAFGIGVGMFVSHLFGSGRAKVCAAHGSIKRDPFTGQEERTVSFPICTNDPNIPDDDCCKHQ